MKDEALKLALEAQQIIASLCADKVIDSKEENILRAAIKQRLAAQPAPVQEPVAWMYPDDYERMTTSETFCTVYSVEVGSATRGESTIALYTTSPAAQPALVQPGRNHYEDGDVFERIAAMNKPAAPVQEPEIVERIKCRAGQTLRTVRNPNVTARESIELANWIVANTTPPAAPQRKPLTYEQRQELMSKAWNEWLSRKDDERLFAWSFSFEVEAAHGIKENT